MRTSGAAAAAATAVIVTMSAMAWRHRRRVQYQQHAEKDDDDDDDNDNNDEFTYIRLTEFEDMALTRGAAPLSTMTWFRGPSPDEAYRVLKQRVEQICTSNPWLLGHFVTKGGKHYIAYNNNNNTTPDVSSRILKRVPPNPTLHRNTPLVDIATHCESLLLKMGHDKHQPFWKVSMVPCSQSPKTTFGLLVSMSHVVGDGHTFYSLHNSLVGGTNITPLIVKRIAKTKQQQQQLMGGTLEQGIMESGGFILCALRGLFLQKILAPLLGWFSSTSSSPYYATSRYFLVDLTVMAQLKQQAAAAAKNNVPFCSSNDIITSWFFRNCGSSHGLLAINFRNRLDGHTNVHAGNYENVLYYRIPDDCDTPGRIRQSLAVVSQTRILKRVVTPTQPISVWELATCRGGIAITTNWASFHAPTVDLGDDNWEQLLHIPIYDLVDNLPSTMAVCIVFQPHPHQLAICIGGTPDKMKGLEDAPFEAKVAFA